MEKHNDIEQLMNVSEIDTPQKSHPQMGQASKQVVLKSGRLSSVERRHPWLFSGALIIKEQPQLGELVNVVTREGDFVARGYYEAGSISVRILTFDATEAIDDRFWLRRLTEALKLRQSLGLTKPEAASYRLIHGEGDGLSGLIIDIYNGVAVIQAHTIGIHHFRAQIADALQRLYGQALHAIYYKSRETLPQEYQSSEPVDQFLLGNVADLEGLIASEEELLFYPDIIKGQKTGFFLDQRDNRKHLQQLAQGRKVLNLFCYTGGFSLAALQGGAEEVVSLDSSAKAMSLLEKNLALNFDATTLQCHESITIDAFKYLQELDEGRFDLIVLDPPAFAKRREVVRNALQGYRKINSEAIAKVAKGGLIYTFSCSQAVSIEQFRQNAFTSALMAKRKVRILKQFGQAPDHPTSIYHPEGEYLKGLLLYVE